MRTKTTGAVEKAPKKTSTSRQPAVNATTVRQWATKARAGLKRSEAPPECIMAAVTPGDARWIAERATGPNCPQAWIVAGVLAEIGSATLRDGAAAATIKSEPVSCLWGAVNRDDKAYTEAVPVFLSSDMDFRVGLDAKRLRRELGEWVGSLIRLGVQVMEAKRGLSFLTESREFDLLADSAALELIQNQEGEAA